MFDLLRSPAAGADRRTDSGFAAAGQTAVIDIGSNSVRLLIYRREGRAFWPIFNEKLLAGLGRGLSDTGRLSESGVEMALRTLRRFAMIIEARGVDEVAAFATAAVRDAEDGADFVAEIARTCGFDVNVLSGQEEGRLSALGAIAGGADAPGLVGDLGGSSLELCPVDGETPQEGVTLKLGPLAVLDDGPTDMKAVRKRIDAELDSVKPMFEAGGDVFYAIGGAWRNLARVDMNLRDYPLHLLHHYEMTRAETGRMTDFVASQSSDSLGAAPEVSSRRAPTLPYAALLLDRLMAKGKFERVVISAYGVREGALFDQMPAELRQLDPLLEAAVALSRRTAPSSMLGDTLDSWIAPVFPADGQNFPPGREAILRKAAATLSDMGSAMHPDHRAELVADQVLHAPFAGIDHPERAYLATALFHRYNGPGEPPADFLPARLSTPGMMASARSMGLALRLGCVFSGRSPSLLRLAELSVGDGGLALTVTPDGAPLATEQCEKRLKQLASALNIESRIVRPGG